MFNYKENGNYERFLLNAKGRRENAKIDCRCLAIRLLGGEGRKELHTPSPLLIEGRIDVVFPNRCLGIRDLKKSIENGKVVRWSVMDNGEWKIDNGENIMEGVRIR